MKLLIDAIAITGGLCVAAGVYLQFGPGFALITGGALLVALAVVAARVNGETDVSDGE